MIPHDPALDAALGSQVWEPVASVTFLDPAGATIPNLSITLPAGVFTSDADRWPRQECQVQIPTSLTPDRTASPVSPWGGSMLIDVGFRYLGLTASFRLATLDVCETIIDRPEGIISVRAASHEARIDEDRYTVPVDSPGGTGSSLIVFLIRRTLGASHPVRNLIAGTPADLTFPARTFTYDGGPWSIIEAIADTIGAEVYFDSTGTAVIAPTPVKGTPVLRYRTGDGGSILGYRSSRMWAPNRVAVVFEDSQTNQRITGLWQDTNPASATRVSGPYGRHTEVTQVPSFAPSILPTQAKADAAAANRARRFVARTRSVDLMTIPAPWIEPGDTVGVDMLGGLSEDLLVASHSFPLDAMDRAQIRAVDDRYTQDLGASGRRAPGD